MSTKNAEAPAIVTGYKGFDSNLRCRGFQYKVGNEYEQTRPAKLCETGFHFCEDPLGVLEHYPPTGRFAEVEGEDLDPKTEPDTKRAARKIRVKAEIALPALIKAGIDFRFNSKDWTKATEKATGARGAASATGASGAASATGDRAAASATGDSGAASATGYSGAASATGYRGAASATGYSGAASATGEEGCAVALGYEGRALGAKGCWLTLAEWKQDKRGVYHRTDVQTVQVDGKKIKADTFYMLRKGKFVEVSE